MVAVIAIDSFKGSLTSYQAGNGVKEAILRCNPQADVVVCPIADGGEGTVEALCGNREGQIITKTVTGPMGIPVTAQYGILPGGTAVLEMSAAAGITLVPAGKRNPMKATTYGVGELIRDAVNRGCRNFLVGIGGSATNDGGTGMLSALGFQFLDNEGKPIALGAEGLRDLAKICADEAMPELKDCQFRIACDVQNPLCGANGCSAVYGPQKGADEKMIAQMDEWLANYGHLAKDIFANADMDYPGTGAAGGLGFAFLTFLNARLESGIRIVLEEIKLEQAIQKADLVITGEGRLDGQSIMGKAPVGVAKLAKKYGKPVIAFCGCLGQGVEACLEHGIDAYYAITPEDMPLEEAMQPQVAYRNLVNTAYEVFCHVQM